VTFPTSRDGPQWRRVRGRVLEMVAYRACVNCVKVHPLMWAPTTSSVWGSRKLLYPQKRDCKSPGGPRKPGFLDRLSRQLQQSYSSENVYPLQLPTASSHNMSLLLISCMKALRNVLRCRRRGLDVDGWRVLSLKAPRGAGGTLKPPSFPLPSLHCLRARMRSSSIRRRVIGSAYCVVVVVVLACKEATVASTSALLQRKRLVVTQTWLWDRIAQCAQSSGCRASTGS
jgi:hypothetical protein